MSDLTIMVWVEERPDAASMDPAYLEGERECRYRDCGNRATWALWRPYRPIQGRRRGFWWLYCAEHNYGRKFEDGVVYQQCRRSSPMHLQAIEQGRRVLDAPELEAEQQEIERRAQQLEATAAEGEEERRIMGSGR